jgi:LPS-assembly protein
MNSILKLTFHLLLTLTLMGEVFAQGPSPLPSKNSTLKNNDPVIISADRITQGSDNNSVLALGRVKIEYQKRKLWADKVFINNKTGVGKAQGHVILLSEDGSRLKAKETYFNLKSDYGRLYQSNAIIKNKRITAKKIERLSSNHIKLDSATLTTCKGALPAWEIEAKTIDIKTGDRALFREAIFKIKNFPILYLPIGYIPMDTTRKSGFLIPTFGWSKIDGVLFDQKYFWAINRWSDATLNTRRVLGGWQYGTEYRYRTSNTTNGTINGNIFKDNITGNNLWAAKMKHAQDLPNKFKFKGVLDLESKQSLNHIVNENIQARTRRNTTSYASVDKRWNNSSLNILTRYQESTNNKQDDVLGELPNISYKIQQTKIGDTPLYFSLDSSSAWFMTDLKPQKEEDYFFKTSRLDFSPKLMLPTSLAPWLSMTSIIGARETFYGTGLKKNGSELEKLSSFTRESFNFRSTIQGPKFNRVFKVNNSPTKFKHLLEPRITYNYIPNMDKNDRLKIKKFDSIDTIANPANSITYGFGQRLLKRIKTGSKEHQTKQILRFNVSQTYNIREATKQKQPGIDRHPFSDIYFDFDSRPTDSLLFNTDASYSIETDSVNKFNFEAGIKPIKDLWLIMERRWTKNGPNYILGTLDMSLKPGWRMQYSARYDELASTFRENQFSLLYDNPCKCWGFAFDVIDRKLNEASGRREDQTQFLWTIKLRGIPDLGNKSKGKFLHRGFEDNFFPNANN